MAERDPRIATELRQPARARWMSRAGRIALMLSVPLLIAAGLIYYYIANDHYVSTDNAYIHQDKVSVSAEVGGTIIAVAVRENQHVKAGDLLFRIDPAPFRIAAAQADASIAAAQVKVGSMETELRGSSVDIDRAREEVAYFRKAYERQAELLRSGFTTRANIEAAEHALAEANSRLAEAIAEAAKLRADLATGQAAPGVNPAVLAGRVQKAQALLNLRRTEVRAPVSGIISQADRLQVGQLLPQSLPAVSIVVDDRSWVDANFKETDLARMRVGQPVEITVDAYPGMTLRGRVASIGAGTGSEFAILPAQNANGNWVKVTQRVPVRIALDQKPDRPLIAGLSTHVRVDTRN
ncbi:MAG TPA: HlyD family secretion protein [Sphingobium sp.]|nr:HlyD family secretion protein [Sphingobium sp.]